MFYQVQHFPILFSVVPSSHIFFHGGCNVYHWYIFFQPFFSVGPSLSDTERIFLANMSSAGAIPRYAFMLGVMWYIDYNFFFYSLFIVPIPLVVLITLLNTSTILSDVLFDLGSLGRDVECTIEWILRNFPLWKKIWSCCQIRKSLVRQIWQIIGVKNLLWYYEYVF